MSIGHMGTSLTVISRWDEALALIENIDVDASTRAAADRAMRVWILVQRGDIAGAREDLDELTSRFDDSEFQMLAARLNIEATVLYERGSIRESLETARRSYRVVSRRPDLHHPCAKFPPLPRADAAWSLRTAIRSTVAHAGRRGETVDPRRRERGSRSREAAGDLYGELQMRRLTARGSRELRAVEHDVRPRSSALPPRPGTRFGRKPGCCGGARPGAGDLRAAGSATLGRAGRHGPHDRRRLGSPTSDVEYVEWGFETGPAPYSSTPIVRCELI